MSSISRSKLLILAPSRLLGLVGDRTFLGRAVKLWHSTVISNVHQFTPANWDHYLKYGWNYANGMYIRILSKPSEGSAKIFCSSVPLPVLLYVLSVSRIIWYPEIKVLVIMFMHFPHPAHAFSDTPKSSQNMYTYIYIYTYDNYIRTIVYPIVSHEFAMKSLQIELTMANPSWTHHGRLAAHYPSETAKIESSPSTS